MVDNAEHYYVNPNYLSVDPHDESRSPAPSPSREEYQATADRRQSRRASPPISEASNAPSSDRGDQAQTQTGINSVSPELIAQITERIKQEVVEHLKQTGTIDATTEPLPPKAEPMQRFSADGMSTPSPPLSARKIYTPPTPNQEARRATVESPPQSPVFESRRVTIESDLPQSPVREARRATVDSDLPQSPVREARRATVDLDPHQSPVRETQQSSPKEKEKPSVRFTYRGPAEKDTRSTRPATNRTYSNAELSTIDQKWGMLFDHDRNPTPRLGQFLRGLANHIIEEFQPHKSIVITPAKMTMYYANHSLEREVYPLLSIFKSNSHEHISQLYQDLGCQHHLVQEDSHKAPIVPGLTPSGFAHWMTTWILAYPDQEASRLEKLVRAIPIDADGAMVDGKPERLPKQISRHLLPSRELSDLKKLLGEAISDFMDELGLPKRKASITSSPPLTRRHSSTQGPQPSRSRPVEVHQTTRPIDIPQSKTNPGIERERMPYSGAPDSASLDSENSIKIERERQPYAAQVGNGKVYEHSGIPASKGRDRANSASRVFRESEGYIPYERHGRTQSNAAPFIPAPFIPAPRVSGARRPPSPPIQRFSQSTPLNLNVTGASSYIPPPVTVSGNSTSQTSSGYTQSSYAPSSYMPSIKIPPPPPRDPSRDRDRDRERDRTGERERDRDRDLRDRERDSRDRHEEPRQEPRRRESRRSTIEDTPRPTIDITSPRDAEKWDRINEERMYEEAKAADPRYESRRDDSIPDEEYYRSNGRAGYENGQYYSRKH